MSKVYKPRNDFVIWRLVDKGMVGKLHVPEASAQGKERIVVAVGPDIKDLKVGDKIYVIGQVGADVIGMPDESNLYICKQANVILIVEED